MEETENKDNQMGGREKVNNGNKEQDSQKPIVTDLDDVLTNELGQFGYFQLRNIILVALPIMMSSFMSEYIFSAAMVPHRCRIPECGENSKFHKFEPDWLLNAVPEGKSGYSSCERYILRDVVIDVNETINSCPSRMFNQSISTNCDTFVYAEVNTVVADFDLACQEWLRALAGFSQSLGTLISLPITGYISDHYGRRVALIVNVFNLGVTGALRAFSSNYTMYVTLQILQSILGGGTFSSAYIFAAEFVGPKYRVLTTATCPSLFAIGQILLASVAWLVHPWRYMILALHIPCFFIISYYWILNESVRWLLSKQKFKKARSVLEQVAKVNNTQISEKSMQALLKPTISTKKDSSNLIKSVFQSPTLLRRVCTTPIWWITATFVYYGLSINSTNLAGNKYLNYIIISCIEIPGNYSSLLLLNRIGRKATLSSAFFFSAICNIAFVFIPKDMYELRLLVYLLGKFGASIVMTTVYLYTSELYPTQYRHSLLGFSSMIGRIGSITAPLTPTLMTYWHGIPSLMFGCMGILSGFLVLTQPETMNTKLPNTLAEAGALGNAETKNS